MVTPCSKHKHLPKACKVGCRILKFDGFSVTENSKSFFFALIESLTAETVVMDLSALQVLKKGTN